MSPWLQHWMDTYVHATDLDVKINLINLHFSGYINNLPFQANTVATLSMYKKDEVFRNTFDNI